MCKIAYIGAGSRGFAKRFLMDIMTRPALADSTVALMDISEENLEVVVALAHKMAKQLGVGTKIEPTTDRRRALDGADYAISTVLLHGIDVYDEPLAIARKYGVNQAVGCTSGPGGVFMFLRYMPFQRSVLKDMEELCPDCVYLHYSNPTSTVSQAMARISPVRSIGMCHSVQGTAQALSRYIEVPYEETGHWVAGVNHQAWFLRFEKQGEDAYPLLWEKMEDPETYAWDPVRFELMRYFGHFVTESSYHNAEYVPYFRKNPELIARFTQRRGGWAGLGDAFTNAERWQKSLDQGDDDLSEEAYGSEPLVIDKSQEYTIGILEAMETNQPFRFNGNVPNSGLITNLPRACAVEVPCLVDNMGIHPCYVGDLPPQCAALNASRVAGDALAVEGEEQRDRDMIEQAIALDPLTAAVCTLDEIRAMVKEIFAAQASYIGSFD